MHPMSLVLEGSIEIDILPRGIALNVIGKPIVPVLVQFASIVNAVIGTLMSLKSKRTENGQVSLTLPETRLEAIVNSNPFIISLAWFVLLNISKATATPLETPATWTKFECVEFGSKF